MFGGMFYKDPQTVLGNSHTFSAQFTGLLQKRGNSKFNIYFLFGNNAFYMGSTFLIFIYGNLLS